MPLHEHTRLPKATIRSVLRILDLVGACLFADYYPNELSGRMKKRGGLPALAVTEPPLLFCDEPTSGLDPINSAQMDQLLLDMRKAYPEMTLIVVSHDLASVAARIAEHVLVLRDGRVVFSGSYEALKALRMNIFGASMDRKAEEKASRVATTATDPDVRAALDAWLEG